jgi:hypothetical protein
MGKFWHDQGHHLNYLRFKLTKVKRCQNLANFHEHGMISFFPILDGSD